MIIREGTRKTLLALDSDKLGAELQTKAVCKAAASPGAARAHASRTPGCAPASALA